MSAMRQLTIALLFCVAILGSLEAQEPVLGTRDVEVKIYLIDIDGIDSVSQSFVANLTLVLLWHDPSLAHEGPDSISKNVNEIWYPRIQILNQQRLVNTFPQSVEIRPDGEVVYRQRVWGSFSQPLELREFPFDTQRLEITLGNIGFGSQNIHLKPSPDSGISEVLSIPDWEIMQWDFAAKDLRLDNKSSLIPVMVFSLEVKRYTNFFKFNVILPLILIVMMSWMVFWIDPSLISSQISVAVTAMLTMIAYRFALAGMLPRLPFLTTMDFFVIASTIMVFLSMVEVIYTAYLSTNNQLEKARVIDRRARWIAPLIYIVLVTETLIIRLWI
jgi:hypothetical protein